MATATGETGTPQSGGEGLHTELKLVDAAAFSVGLIGPVGAIGLLGTGAAAIIGRAVTLSFIFAIIGVALIGYCFIKLSQHIAHTGSVYALVGKTLGPHTGFFAGWTLAGAYTAIGCGSTIEMGLFGQNFLNDTFGLHITEYWWIALIGLLGCSALAFNEIRIITRALLTSEVAGAILVTILSVVILATVIFSHGPGGQTFSFNFVVPPSGLGIGPIAHAAVYGFLAFAGFEGAAALGEETANPKTEIPRALKVAIVVVGSFFLLTATAQGLGYGANAKGAAAFAGGLPFSDLGAGYIAHWYADVLNLMAFISLFAISLGTASGAARIIYALSRDSMGQGSPLATLSRHGAPARALALVLTIFGCVLIGQRIAGSTVINATFYALQVGTVLILVSYLLATVGAAYFIFFKGKAKAPMWQLIIPILAGAFVVMTIYYNTIIFQEGTYKHLPFIELVWMLIGVAVVFTAPGLAGRVRAGLAAGAVP